MTTMNPEQELDPQPVASEPTVGVSRGGIIGAAVDSYGWE
jgi:hypothetical protein